MGCSELGQVDPTGIIPDRRTCGGDVVMDAVDGRLCGKGGGCDHLINKPTFTFVWSTRSFLAMIRNLFW